MFAYCGNNSVNRSDPSGANWLNNIMTSLKHAISKIGNALVMPIAAAENTAAINYSQYDPQAVDAFKKASAFNGVQVSQPMQQTVNKMAQYEWLADLSVALYTPTYPVTGSLNAGISKTISMNDSYYTPHVGTGVGISASPLPVGVGYSVGIVKRHSGLPDHLITGRGNGFSENWSMGFLGYSTAGSDDDIRTYLFTVSTDPLGMSTQYSYSWDRK